MRGLLPACAASLRHEQDDQSNDKSCNASHRERHRERDQDKRLEALSISVYYDFAMISL